MCWLFCSSVLEVTLALLPVCNRKVCSREADASLSTGGTGLLYQKRMFLNV
jgi:hypothetical protein